MTDFAGYAIEDLEEGMEASFSKTISDADIVAYAGISGDTNPVHLDEAYASATRFGGRIAHGMLSASLISAVIGTRLPGPGAIYMSQSLRFRAPVKPGDVVTATARVSALDREKRRATIACAAHVGETLVIDGEALVMVPGRAEKGDKAR
ncbi:MAG: MaoC family dehydratase [Parvibaculum sp.]|jgi:3-hydroxybutyryl-CoA dehydratase|uniref:MaoC family dehydratase n=1 Tax=Parvibaculum sp. TaxID=2024848 RepID=UPI00283C4BC2|nr:MaoC family dehydratase [Parvibaculum sp.]MDR3498339.1 MaoC family dehydratase [Parvibaculum sp.]